MDICFAGASLKTSVQIESTLILTILKAEYGILIR
jgi:hypothetical protein